MPFLPERDDHGTDLGARDPSTALPDQTVRSVPMVSDDVYDLMPE